jgi:hypothetical protein
MDANYILHLELNMPKKIRKRVVTYSFELIMLNYFVGSLDQ